MSQDAETLRERRQSRADSGRSVGALRRARALLTGGRNGVPAVVMMTTSNCFVLPYCPSLLIIVKPPLRLCPRLHDFSAESAQVDDEVNIGV